MYRINFDNFDNKVSPAFKSYIVLNFESKVDKKLDSCLDLSNVDEMNSSGLASLLVFRRMCINHGQNDPYLVIKENGYVERLLNISQFHTVFNIVYDLNKL